MKDILLILFSLAALTAAATTVTLESGTPVLRAAEFPPEVIAVAEQPVELEVTGNTLLLVKQHPLARYFRLTQVRLPDGRTGYMNPNIYADRTGKLEFGSMVEWWRFPLAALFGGGLAALLAILWKQRGKPDPWRWLELGLVPVLLRQFLLLLLVNRAQNIVNSPADEPGYYANLLSILSWNFSEPWHFTVGTSLFYLPFELLSGTREFNDLVVPLSYAEGFIIAPASLFLGYLLGRKLTGSNAKACAAMLMWAVVPFIWHHRPDFTGKLFHAFFNFPSWEFTYRHYINLISCGFSSMSDTPSTMLMLLVMALLACRPATAWNAAAAAFLFGIGCMFRINNILFLPGIAAMVFFLRPEYFANGRRLLLTGALSAAAFILGFLPQFLANWKFFGNPLQFSYTNYAEGAHTYLAWIFVQLNSAFYGTTNLLVWIPGVLSLLFMTNRKLRIMLAFWAIPVILFFFGYSHGTDDPIRFILTSYPAFFLAIAGSGLWEKLHRSDIAPAALYFTGWIFCTPNATLADYGWYFGNPLHLLWRLNGFSGFDLAGIAAMIAGTAFLMRRSRRLGLFLGTAATLYVFGNAYLLALLLCATLAYATVELMLELRKLIPSSNRI